MLLVDSDDEELGFMDSKTLKSAEMEPNLITRCAAAGSFNPTHVTLILQRTLAFRRWIQNCWPVLVCKLSFTLASRLLVCTFRLRIPRIGTDCVQMHRYLAEFSLCFAKTFRYS